MILMSQLLLIFFLFQVFGCASRMFVYEFHFFWWFFCMWLLRFTLCVLCVQCL